MTQQAIPNTFGIEAYAAQLLVVNDETELQGLLFDTPPLIVGAGSDLVFTRNYAGTVLQLANRTDVQLLADGTLSVWGGMELDQLVLWTLEHGLYGLENLSAIPGTVGAAAVQNVGAYGAEAAQFIVRVHTHHLLSGQRRTYSASQCRFGYRASRFKSSHEPELVYRVELRLATAYTPNLAYKALEGLPHATAMQLREAVTALRWSKLPRPEEHGSAGSYFKNPVADPATVARLQALHPDMPVYPGGKLSAGWLIEHAGWKGRTLGRAGVWPKQALVLYNTGGCTGAEVVQLAQAIQHDVWQQFGVELCPEAIVI